MHPSSSSSSSSSVRWPFLCCSLVVLYATGKGLTSSAPAEHRQVLQPTTAVSGNATILQESPPTAVRCANNYTMTCVKRDVLAFLDALDGERSYEIYPGFTLFQRRSSSSSPPPSNESLDAVNSTQLDQLIAKRLNDFAESVDLRVKLLGPIDTTSRSVGASVLERILPFLRMSRKKKDHQGLYWAVGTMAAVGASALMALSSKALMTAGAALAMAIYSCMKGGGGHGKGGGSHLTATLMEESALVPHRQCAEAVVDITGTNYPADVERYPGSRKTVEIVSPAMPVYRIHQASEDYSSYGSSLSSSSQTQYP